MCAQRDQQLLDVVAVVVAVRRHAQVAGARGGHDPIGTGKLVVEVADAEHELNVGDSAQFDSRLPHRYVNPHRRPTEFIISVTPPSY